MTQDRALVERIPVRVVEIVPAAVVEMVPVLVVEMVPVFVVEIVPVLVVEMVPVLVVEMVPVFAIVAPDTARTNVAAQAIDLRFFIVLLLVNLNVRGQGRLRGVAC